MFGLGSVGANTGLCLLMPCFARFLLVFLAPYGSVVGPARFLAVFWLSVVGQLALTRANGDNKRVFGPGSVGGNTACFARFLPVLYLFFWPHTGPWSVQLGFWRCCG